MNADLESGDPEAICSALTSLIQALVDHRAGSPEQAVAWENALLALPKPLGEFMPSLATLNALAQKAWPDTKEYPGMK